MKVLYVSKASVVPAYQDKLCALSRHGDVEALIPARWGKHVTSIAEADVSIRTSRALLHGHNHFHFYPDGAAVLRHVRPDLVHIDEEPYSVVTFQFARMCHRAGISFVFFAWPNIAKQLPPPFGLLRRYVFAHAAAAIAGTVQAAAVLRSAGWRGIDAVIPQLGVNPERFRRDDAARAATREALAIPTGAFVAGYAGRLVAEKGVDVLLDAVAQRGDPDEYVIIIGDGPDRAGLAARARMHGIDARVRFAGPIDSLAMPQWLNAVDTLVLPSRTTRTWSEQFGRVLIEAMACEVPVIGADSGEIRHVIGEAGFIFAEGDAAALAALLAALHANVGLRAQFGAAARARVLAHFTQANVASETVALYERVLARGGRAVRSQQLQHAAEMELS